MASNVNRKYRHRDRVSRQGQLQRGCYYAHRRGECPLYNKQAVTQEAK